MSRSMLVKALGAVFAGALALTGCGIADAMNPSNVLSFDHHEASSAVERNGSSVSETAASDRTNGFGYTIPSYCGDKSTYVLTTTGEVYQVFLPDKESKQQTDLNIYGIGSNGQDVDSTAKCMIPINYLPVDVNHETLNTYNRVSLPYEAPVGTYGYYYDALGAGKDGSLYATRNVSSKKSNNNN